MDPAVLSTLPQSLQLDLLLRLREQRQVGGWGSARAGGARCDSACPSRSCLPSCQPQALVLVLVLNQPPTHPPLPQAANRGQFEKRTGLPASFSQFQMEQYLAGTRFRRAGVHLICGTLPLPCRRQAVEV